MRARAYSAGLARSVKTSGVNNRRRRGGRFAMQHLDMGARVSFNSMKDQVSPEEWDTREQLAACFRLVEHYGYNGTINNHISARVPGEPDHFLINPGGYLFSELCASSLVKVHMDGCILSEAPTGIVNPAGYVIHSAALEARPEVRCVIHLHTIAGVAVSAQSEGLKFYCQESMRFFGRIGFHDYEGIARDVDERDSLRRDLGRNTVLLLRNHGTLVVGRSIAEAFTYMMNFERSCQVQMALEASRGELIAPPPEICEQTRGQTERGNEPTGEKAWRAYRRIADCYYPSYMN
jgi:ribulose-5-phosphate 4-epimerase/fuculose-1-phosphate aldolase